MANTNDLDSVDEKFWLEDPTILVRDGNLFRILPSGQMAKVEVLNTLTLFFIYVAIVLLILQVDVKYLYIPLIAIIGIIACYYMYRNDQSNIIEEKYEDSSNSNENFGATDPSSFDEFNGFDGSHGNNKCQMPTMDNPFMNMTVADLIEGTNRMPACKLQTSTRTMDQNYSNNNLFERQFYTMPVSTLVNDQTGFARALYNTPTTCKEDPMHCVKYEDIRYNKPI